MTSANDYPDKPPIDETEKKESKKKGEGEVALDPNPSKALTELATGSENTTSTGETGSKDA